MTLTKRISIFLFVVALPWIAVSEEQSPEQIQEQDIYTLPLRFAIMGDGVSRLPLELAYDLSSQHSLQMGDIRFSVNDFKVDLGNLEEISPAAAPYTPESVRNNVHLVMQWPVFLVPEGKIEAIGQSGRIIWETSFTKRDVELWQNFISDVRLRMEEANINKADIQANRFLNSTWAFRNVFSGAESLVKSQESFRFCISNTAIEGQSRLCSAYMNFRNVDRKWRVEPVPSVPKPARIIAFQKSAPLAGRQRLRTKAPVQFMAELNNGMIYEFISRPPAIEIVEFVQTENNTMKVVGFGQPPAMNHRILNPLEEGVIVRALKWQETIGDFRRFWEVEIPLNSRQLFFPGPSGGLFRQEFRIRRLPREAIRPYVNYRTPNSTYVNASKIFGIKAKETTIASDQLELETDEDSPDEFLWRFQAENRGEMNRAIATVTDKGETFKVAYEMYKGYPREVSLRSSAIFGSGGNIMATGEGAFNYWFEDIFGWSNYYLAKQRWGVSAKYFQTLTPVKISTVNAEMSNMTFDLKYRLTPGLWNRDETWGLILGYNQVTYNIFKAQQMGVGFFWARSMPKLFDDMFNKLPVMRYPKWVDLEFVYYPTILNSKAATPNNPPKGAGSFALNFHGKVLWTKSFFGEGGFGVKNLDFTHNDYGSTPTRLLRLQFLSIYGTVGIGYQF